MSVVDVLNRILSETPQYMSHVTVARNIIESLLTNLKELADKVSTLEKRVKELEK